MKSRFFVTAVFGSTLALAGAIVVAQAPLAINTATITIAGTSNVHDYTATTAEAKVTRVEFGDAVPGPTFWEDVQKPGGLQAFDLSIPAATLKSSKDGLDKNMYKALKVTQHPQITFSLTRMEGAPGALKAFGTLTVAGVAQEVTLPLKTTPKGAGLMVTGELNVLMTDYGIAPPKAMLGMVRADPKIKITFEVLLGVAST
jgi:polyisoprenoid-binding protein YceI